MFKSAENLRLAAEMRVLQRVAAPWRQSRTAWFDGTPESLEARLAATERVLTQARSGLTGEHLALAREAGAARDELLAARHRLLTDFLDDGARAFRGGRRVTAGEDEFIDCPYCGAESYAAEYRNEGGHCPSCGRANYELPGYMASRRTAGEGMSWEDSQDYISDALSKGEHGMAARPTTPERPGWNRHGHPIHQGQEVYWADETTGEVTEPHPLAGRIVEHPAVDPDGNVHHDMATVEWPDYGYDLHHIDELVPKDRHHGTWDPDTEQDPFDPRLIGASRTASSGGLDCPEPGLNDSGVDYENLMNPKPDLDDDFGHIFGSRRTASGQLDDLTQRKALNLVRQWMHNRYGDEDSKDPMVPSGQKAYESGAGPKLHPSWSPTWQDPITGEMNEEHPRPAIMHEGYPGWADEASFDEDLNERLRQVGVEVGNWYGNTLSLHPYREWSIPPHATKQG